MPRDYSRNRNDRSSGRRDSRQNYSQSSSGLSWMLIGILVGLCIAGVAYLNQSKNHNAIQSNINSTQQMALNQSATHSAATTKKANTNNPQFDFYNMLPSAQVSSPTATEANAAQTTTDNVAPTTPPPNPAKVNAILSGVTPPPANANLSSASTVNAQLKTNATPVNNTNQKTDEASNATDQNTTAAPVNNTGQTNNTDDSEQPVSANSVDDNGEIITAPKNTVKSHVAKTTQTQTLNTPPDNSIATASGGQYVIQLAAFAHFQQADQFKAQLAFTGYEAKIVAFKKNGRTLQRVWLGPYPTLTAAAEVQRQLATNQIKSTLLRTDQEM